MTAIAKHKPASYTDYYIFQMNDGTWRIAERTEHQWNGMPTLPREYEIPYGTESDACAALNRAKELVHERQ